MANPQKENGYTAIANEVLEALVKVRLPPSEKDVLFFIIRKTYGYNKKEDRISLTQFEKGTELSRPTIVKALYNLIVRNMVVKAGLPLRFNKDYEKWVVNAGLLVKSKHEFGKGGFTKIGKGGFTYKRQKKTKEIPAKAGVMKNYKENTIDYETGQQTPEPPKLHKRKDCIELALRFDELASKYAHIQITTPRSYFIVLNAINTHRLTYDGILKIFEEWFINEKTKPEDKVKLSWCLGKDNINSFKMKHR